LHQKVAQLIAGIAKREMDAGSNFPKQVEFNFWETEQMTPKELLTYLRAQEQSLIR